MTEEDKLYDKLRDLLGRRQVLMDELDVQRQRVNLLRVHADNLLHLNAAQGGALDLQGRLMKTYAALCGGDMDDTGAAAFKQNILFIMSGSPAWTVEQAVPLQEPAADDEVVPS